MISHVPVFLIIGAMRAGTTTLYRDLRGHPSIFLPEDKEPNVLREAMPIETYRSRYHRLFHGAKPDQICGEASTTYTKLPDFPGVPPRARLSAGSDLKIIYLVRNPIHRIISQHHYETGMRQVNDRLEVAVRSHPRYINYSRYAMQILPWIEEFGPANVMVIPFEHYISSRETTIRRLCSFLGIDPSKTIIAPEQKFNAASRLPVNTPTWRHFVFHRSWYRYHVKPLLPRRFRETAARLILPRAPERPEPLSKASASWLRNILGEDVDELRKLFPSIAFPWPEFVSPPNPGRPLIEGWSPNPEH
jgi:hypothetical protein